MLAVLQKLDDPLLNSFRAELLLQFCNLLLHFLNLIFNYFVAC